MCKDIDNRYGGLSRYTLQKQFCVKEKYAPCCECSRYLYTTNTIVFTIISTSSTTIGRVCLFRYVTYPSADAHSQQCASAGEKNNIAKQANVSNNVASMMESASFDGGGNGEHNGVGFVKMIDKTCNTGCIFPWNRSVRHGFFLTRASLFVSMPFFTVGGCYLLNLTDLNLNLNLGSRSVNVSSRCHMPNGKVKWLCKEHQGHPRITVLKDVTPPVSGFILYKFLLSTLSVLSSHPAWLLTISVNLCSQPTASSTLLRRPSYVYLMIYLSPLTINVLFT